MELLVNIVTGMPVSFELIWVVLDNGVTEMPEGVTPAVVEVIPKRETVT